MRFETDESTTSSATNVITGPTLTCRRLARLLFLLELAEKLLRVAADLHGRLGGDVLCVLLFLGRCVVSTGGGGQRKRANERTGAIRE